MEPPPTVRYSPFNSLSQPRGRFEWSILSEAFEVVKAYPIVFMGFSLIGYFGTAILGQIASIPQVFAQFSDGPVASKVAIFAVSYVLSLVAQSIGIGVAMGGYVSMLRRYGESKFVDIGDGFKPISKALHLGLAQLAPMIACLPFYLIAAAVAWPHLGFMVAPRAYDESEMLTHILGIAVPFLVVAPATLFIYPWFFGAVPAIVLEDVSVVEAIKRSFQMVRKCFWQLFVMQFLLGAVMAVAIMLCCIPALFAFAWHGVTLGLIYSNVMGIPLAPPEGSMGYSNYPRQSGGDMPAAPEPPRPTDFPPGQS